ncbi:hypothetical protein CVT26_008865 [Gymnopilus dilepis]|uniref:Uncharacterized protein n=1 Tax=Gymnopilus dilepis TaxID=231916 RepID=A0A409WX99_9AGAR|nr:hypothetical protein CVT26_008865 [Gymnopilus dilepis]
MFSEVIEAQRRSDDLTVYSRPVESLVRIAWPIRQGVPIVPKGVKNYLDGKGIFWECFCAIISEEARPCRIVVSRQDGDVLAFCHHLDDSLKCGFFMNLCSKLDSTTLFSEYGHVPSAKMGLQANLLPYVLAYRHQAQLHETAPFFDGYLGEFTSEHRGAKQLNSGLIYHGESKDTKIVRLYATAATIMASPSPRIVTVPPQKSRVRSNIPVEFCEQGGGLYQQRKRRKISHSMELYCGTHLDSISETPAAGHLTSFPKIADWSAQGQCLERLSRGEGLTHLEFESLVERCGTCGRYFLPQVLRSHIPKCSN